MKFYFLKLDKLLSKKTNKIYDFIVIIDENGHSFRQFIKDSEVARFQSEYDEFDDITDEISFRYDSKIFAYLPYIK